MYDPQSDEIQPVILTFLSIRQRLSRYSNLLANKFGSLFPVINANNLRYYCLSVALASGDFSGLPLTFATEQPAIIIQDGFTRIGVRKHFDPSPNSEQANNATHHHRLGRQLTNCLPQPCGVF
jgi:hypothetical protein